MPDRTKAYWRARARYLDEALDHFASTYPGIVDQVRAYARKRAAGHAGGVAGPRTEMDGQLTAGIHAVLRDYGLPEADARELARRIDERLTGEAEPVSVQEAKRLWEQGLAWLLENARRVLEAHTDNVMVALYPDPGVAQQLALDPEQYPGAISPDDLHVTLCLPAVTEDDAYDRLSEIVQAVSLLYPPMTGEIAGHGFFHIELDGVDSHCLYLSPDVPTLPAFRQGVVEALSSNGFDVLSDHGFIPHLTLGYFSERPDYESDMHAHMVIRFNRVSLAFGDTVSHYELRGDPERVQEAWNVTLALRHAEEAFQPAPGDLATDVMGLARMDEDEFNAIMRRTVDWARDNDPDLLAVINAKVLEDE